MLQSLGWTTKASAEAGDFSPGNGITTAGKTVVAGVNKDAGNIAGINAIPQAEGTAAGHPVYWWLALVLLYFAFHMFFAKDESNKSVFWDIADTTIKVVIGLSIAKWFFSLIRIPGLSDVVVSS